MPNFTLSTADADLLRHLAKAGHLILLRLLFDNVLIPKYVMEKEIKPKGKKVLAPIWEEVRQKNWLLIVDRDDLEPVQRAIYDAALSDARAAMDDPGEAHGIALAQATGASFFLSNDNKPNGPHDVIYRIKTLDMTVKPLTHQDILFLAKSVGKLSISECQEIHDLIRSVNGLNRMPQDINVCMRSSFQKLINEEWLVEFLRSHKAPQVIIDKIKQHHKQSNMEISLSAVTNKIL